MGMWPCGCGSPSENDVDVIGGALGGVNGVGDVLCVNKTGRQPGRATRRRRTGEWNVRL